MDNTTQGRKERIQDGFNKVMINLDKLDSITRKEVANKLIAYLKPYQE